MLAAAPFALAARWRQRLGVLVASAGTLDAAVTTFEAFSWNAPRVRSVAEAAAVLVACLAPVVGAAVLWGAVARMAVAARSRARLVVTT